MSVKSKEVLKSYFQDGDVPVGSNFGDLVDSFLKVPETINCSSNPLYPVSNTGDTYKVIVDGKIGGSNGLTVVSGALLIALESSSEGDQQTVGTKWLILNNFGTSINVSSYTVSGFTTLANDGLLETGRKYILTNPADGGKIVVEASSSKTINANSSWITNQNWKAFGWFRLSAGTSGSVTALNINGANVLSASIPFNTSLNQTATDIATNINSGPSGYKAYAINDLCVIEYQTVTTSANNWVVAAIVTGTLQTADVLNMSRGGDSSIVYSLPIKYDLQNDCIEECSDSNGNFMSYNFSSGNTPRPITIFRWNDPSYVNNRFELCAYKQNFYVPVTGFRFSNNVFLQGSQCQYNAFNGTDPHCSYNHVGQSSSISKNYCLSGGRIYYNIIDVYGSINNNRIGAGIIRLNHIKGLGIDSYGINNNSVTNGFIHNNIINVGASINDNQISFSLAQIYGNSLLSHKSSISSNTLSAQSVQISKNCLSGEGSFINSNVLSILNASISSNILLGLNATITSKTISNVSNNIDGFTFINGKTIFNNINSLVPDTNSKMLVIDQITKAVNFADIPSGQGALTLTGDISGSGTSSFATVISNQAVTFGKFQNIGTNKMLGRSTAASGSVEEISLGTEFSLSGGTLSLSTSGVSLNKIQNLTSNNRLLGRASVGAGSVEELSLGTSLSVSGGILDLINGGITLSKVQNIATNKLLGRGTAGSGAAEELTIGTGLSLSGGILSSNGYVDNALNNISQKAVCRVATISDLWVTYNNGSSGVGATLTHANPTLAPLVIDNVTLALNDRVLVRLQSVGLQNGIYRVTNIGSSSIPWVLTRAQDNDTASKIYQTTVVIKEGQTYSNIEYVNTNTSTAIVVGTTDLTFKISNGFTFGGGLTFSGSSVFISANGVSRANLANGIATSIIGRSANSTGAMADIQAATDGHILRRAGGVLGFGFVSLTKIANKTAVNANAAATSALTWNTGLSASNTIPLYMLFRYNSGTFSPSSLSASLTLNGVTVKSLVLTSLASGCIKSIFLEDVVINNTGNWAVVITTPIGQAAVFDIEIWGTV